MVIELVGEATQGASVEVEVPVEAVLGDTGAEVTQDPEARAVTVADLHKEVPR